MKKIISAALLLAVLSAHSVFAEAVRETPVVKAIQKIEKSVVNIRTEKVVKKKFNPFGADPFFDDFFGFNRVYKTQSLGSGVLVDNKGTVITNYHVVEAATKIYVLLSNNETSEAEVIGGDKGLDLAVLRLKNVPGDIPYATMGTSSDIMLGETVIAMGNPYGLSNSVTTGVISAVNRVMKISSEYSTFIQSDALINPGNSGGPLVNIKGELIGINTAIYKQAQGIGFSIPIDTVKRILPELTVHKKIRRGYLGFSVEEIETESGGKLIIEEVDRNSGAYKAGLRAGDEIFEAAGVPVSTKSALLSITRSFPPGSILTLKIKRGSELYKAKIRMGVFPEKYGLKYLRDTFGLEIKETKDYLVVAKSTVSDVIAEGDIIIALNKKEINSLDELNSLLNRYSLQKMLLTVYRNGRMLNITMTP